MLAAPYSLEKRTQISGERNKLTDPEGPLSSPWPVGDRESATAKSKDMYNISQDETVESANLG